MKKTTFWVEVHKCPRCLGTGDIPVETAGGDVLVDCPQCHGTGDLAPPEPFTDYR